MRKTCFKKNMFITLIMVLVLSLSFTNVVQAAQDEGYGDLKSNRGGDVYYHNECFLYSDVVVSQLSVDRRTILQPAVNIEYLSAKSMLLLAKRNGDTQVGGFSVYDESLEEEEWYGRSAIAECWYDVPDGSWFGKGASTGRFEDAEYGDWYVTAMTDGTWEYESW